ncbi:MAG TPA: sigma 54-interacting transcriptional regulator [Symbiobacteriaceae bacterium]|nr:sigma 54-interacting transcriptional regulator [Symbiobacteriaceae bacterium]
MSDLLEAAVDHSEEGVIIVDVTGRIKVYNRKAREIFAIDPRIGPGHPAGRIKPGDIVAIADTCIGHDDGGLSPEDLKLIGVDPTGIRAGDSIVAIGVFGAPPGTAVWQFCAGTGFTSFEVCRSLDNLKHVKARIDGLKKQAVISVGPQTFEVPYQLSIGHMVLVSPDTLDVTFYQARGYTARGEGLRDLLNGKTFVTKGPHAAMPEVIGRHILELHPDSVSVHHLLRVARGERDAVKDQEYPINGIPVRCSVVGLYGPTGLMGGLLLVRDLSEVKYLERQLKHSVVKPAAFSHIAGNSREIMEVIRVADCASQTKSTVLILGESGSGKGLLAKAIHQNSPRRDGPFVQVNLAAIPATLVESELFGYEEGAFTGARRRGKPGLFQLANGGTIFLDEIGEADMHLQAKLLQVLQEKCVRSVGSVRDTVLDVRVIAASNRNLEEGVQQGTFRKDLFYRLHVIGLHVPSLRERRTDIPEIISSLLPVVSHKVGKEVKVIEPATLLCLVQYDWPGNIRELENVLERACNLAEGDTIRPEHLPALITQGQPEKVHVAPLKEILDAAEKEALMRALEAAGDNRSQAMKLLGVGRTSFYEKLARHNLI